MQESLLETTKKQIHNIYKKGDKPSNDASILTYAKDLSRTLNFIQNVIEKDSDKNQEEEMIYKKGYVPPVRIKFTSQRQKLMEPIVKYVLSNKIGNNNFYVTNKANYNKGNLLATRETVQSDKLDVRLEPMQRNIRPNEKNLIRKIIKKSPHDKHYVIEYIN